MVGSKVAERSRPAVGLKDAPSALFLWPILDAIHLFVGKDDPAIDQEGGSGDVLAGWIAEEDDSMSDIGRLSQAS
jgi:hypothetical protein